MKPEKPIVLVVDDEAIIRMMLIDLLEDAGLDVLEAGTADDALRVLEEVSHVSMVLTDIEMPGQLSGIDLANLARARWPHIELLVMSGRTFPPPGTLPAGIEFWRKPYSTERLISHVRQLTSPNA